MSEVITRDDLIELSCGHLATPNAEDPNGSTYCQSCGLHLLPTPTSLDRQFILDHAREILETKLATLRHTYEARKRLDKPLGDNIEGLIAQHERALKRIAAGKYGTCADCDVEIESERLRLFPHAVLCVPCVSKEKAAVIEVPLEASTEPETELPADNKTSSGAGPGERTYADLALPEIHRGGTVIDSIPVKSIKPSPDNPRAEVGDVSELAATIAKVGLLNPVILKENGDGTYYLTTGHRRYAAIQSLGWDVIPAQVENTRSDREVEEARLIENIQREDLTPLEEAKAFRRMTDRYGVSQKELAESVGRSQAHISKRLSLLELPAGAVELVVKGPVSGGISLEDAQLLGKVKDKKAVEKIVKDFRPGSRWHSIEFLVDEQVKRERAAEKKKKAIEKLTKDGVKLVSFDSLHKIDFKKRATVGGQYGELGVDLKEHKAEPCHRARVEDGGRVTHYCIDQQRHTKKGASKLKATVKGTETRQLSEKDAARAERERSLATASEARKDFVKSTIGKKKAKPDDVFCLLVLALSADAETAGDVEVSAGHVCQFLGIEPKHTPGESYQAPQRRTLANLIAKDPSDGAHIVTAIAVDAIEWQLQELPYVGGDLDYRAYRPYFDWLEKQGYELSEFEADELADKKEETPAA